MFAYDKNSMEAMTGPAREIFEQWISFFPTAPLFGVEWRFADSVRKYPVDLAMFTPGFNMFAGFPSAETAKPAARKPRPATPQAKPDPVEAAVVVKAAPAKIHKTEKSSAEPATNPADGSAPAVKDGGSVEQIRGIGPRLAAELAGMGITTIAQIAALSKAELTRIDARLTTIKGRCFRDDWVGQAKALMAD